MSYYDENGNRIVFQQQRVRSGSNGCLPIFLFAVIVFLIFVLFTITGGIFSFVTDAPSYVDDLSNKLNSPPVLVFATSEGETSVIVQPHNMKLTAETILQNSSPTETHTPMATSTPIYTATPTSVPSLFSGSGGDLPNTLPYTTDQVNTCRDLLDSGVPMVSPQYELCKIVTGHEQ